MDALRKAAVLLASLDRETADQLLEQMPQERAAIVRNAIMGLPDVNRVEERATIQEFLCSGEPEHNVLPGVDQDHAATAPARTESCLPLDESSETSLGRASERLIAECLCEEMPQTIALALSQLSTERASEVVSYLPASVQAQVLERLVQFDASRGPELTEIRDEFHEWLNEQIERSLHRVQLAARLAAILGVTHQGTRQRILDNISHSDGRLAKELQLRLS